MTIVLKLSVVDASLVRRVLSAMAGLTDGASIEDVLNDADIQVPAYDEAVKNIARIAAYIETVERAG